MSRAYFEARKRRGRIKAINSISRCSERFYLSPWNGDGSIPGGNNRGKGRHARKERQRRRRRRRGIVFHALSRPPFEGTRCPQVNEYTIRARIILLSPSSARGIAKQVDRFKKLIDRSIGNLFGEGLKVLHYTDTYHEHRAWCRRREARRGLYCWLYTWKLCWARRVWFASAANYSRSLSRSRLSSSSWTLEQGRSNVWFQICVSISSFRAGAQRVDCLGMIWSRIRVRWWASMRVEFDEREDSWSFVFEIRTCVDEANAML